MTINKNIRNILINSGIRGLISFRESGLLAIFSVVLEKNHLMEETIML